MTIRPPRINGQVPEDYRGPLYYRVQIVSYRGGRNSLHEMLGYENRKALARLARIDIDRVARREDPILCDASGDLLAEWRTPFQARPKGGARENWDEFATNFISAVSPRIKDAIEEFAPGVHYFIPIDIDDGQGGSFRAFFFFCGVGWPRTAVAAEASGITGTITTLAGDRVPAFPDFIGSERFAYLNESVIGSAPLFYDGRLSFVFSEDLVRRLGDVLPGTKAFVPIGVA